MDDITIILFANIMATAPLRKCPEYSVEYL